AVLELEDGEIHEIPAGETGVNRYHRLQFRKHTINMKGAGGMLERSARSDREKSAAALIEERRQVIEQYGQSLERTRRQFLAMGASEADLPALAPERESWDTRWRLMWSALLHRRSAGLSVEIHKKFALLVACVVFVLIGAPIGMRVKRAGPAVAFVSIGF